MTTYKPNILLFLIQVLLKPYLEPLPSFATHLIGKDGQKNHYPDSNMSKKLISIGNVLMEDDGIAIIIAHMLETTLLQMGIEVI